MMWKHGIPDRERQAVPCRNPARRFQWYLFLPGESGESDLPSYNGVDPDLQIIRVFSSHHTLISAYSHGFRVPYESRHLFLFTDKKDGYRHLLTDTCLSFYRRNALPLQGLRALFSVQPYPCVPAESRSCTV